MNYNEIADKQATLTHSELLQLLHYEPSTGVFTWCKTSSNRAVAGSVAGSLTNTGYWTIRVNTVPFQAHRLAWFYMTGEWPKEQLDHKNLDRRDNRWENLRQATNTQNQRNRRARKDNSCGVRGVHFSKKDRVWVAQIAHTHLGSFIFPEEAALAYQKAAKKLYGEFASYDLYKGLKPSQAADDLAARRFTLADFGL